MPRGPSVEELAPAQQQGDVAVLDMVASVLGAVRRAKADAQVSMRAPVAKLTVVDNPERLALLPRGGIGPARRRGCRRARVASQGPLDVIVELAPKDTGDKA